MQRSSSPGAIIDGLFARSSAEHVDAPYGHQSIATRYHDASAVCISPEGHYDRATAQTA